MGRKKENRRQSKAEAASRSGIDTNEDASGNQTHGDGRRAKCHEQETESIHQE